MGSTLRALPPPARRLLLTASVIAGRVKLHELSSGGGRAVDWLALLTRHFFVEIADGAVSVHDLVREAALRVNTPLEICARRDDELIETLPGGWRLVRGLVARQTK